MSIRFSPLQLDVSAFAAAGASMASEIESTDGGWPGFDRLLQEACEPNGLASVKWRVHAELRPGPTGEPQPWLHVQAQATLQLLCQRCLGSAPVVIDADRWFRFVADEATAAAEDDESEEDVLALVPRFNLIQLVEDELLMSIPLVPMHDVCPEAIPLSAGEEEFQAAIESRPSPFAALLDLKKPG